MATPTPRSGILDITPYIPGGSMAPAAPTRPMARLASNESPLGASPLAVEAYNQGANLLHHYPDGAASALRAALAEHHGLDADRIVCGAGSDELLSLIARCYAGPGDNVVMSEFGFLVYPIVTMAAGATPVIVPEPDLRSHIDGFIGAADDNTRIVFIANPNNPTASYVSGAEILRLREGLPAHTLLVVDVAYAEYAGVDDFDSGFSMVEDHDNVVITRTFSKIFGLAGLRLGWAYCPAAIADVLNRVRGPFNVTGPALAAGLAAVGDQAHVDRARRHNDRWLPWVADELAKIGLTVYPSVANFLLVRFPERAGQNARTADAANALLLEHGLVVREMGGYKLPDCLRIGIGLEDDMRRLVDVLREFMAP
ncbi:MAG: histidinol-phosphate transaminase [Alphaproteobacteria bacterium]